MRGQCAGARESDFSMRKCRFFTKKSPSRKEKGKFTKIPPQSGDQPRDRDRRRDEEHEDKDDGAVDPVPREPLIARTGEKGENEIVEVFQKGYLRICSSKESVDLATGR